MSDPLFQEAYARARGRYDDSGWLALTPREITTAIYEEIRRLDAERVAFREESVPSEAGENRSTSVSRRKSAVSGGQKMAKPRDHGPEKTRKKMAEPVQRHGPSSAPRLRDRQKINVAG